MIRIVKQIFVRSLDTEGDWLLLPLVPTTATLDMGHTPEEAGDLTSYQLEATLRFCPDTARHNLCVKVVFDDDSSATFGTEDLPVKLEITQAETTVIECDYEC